MKLGKRLWIGPCLYVKHNILEVADSILRNTDKLSVLFLSSVKYKIHWSKAFATHLFASVSFSLCRVPSKMTHLNIF